MVIIRFLGRCCAAGLVLGATTLAQAQRPEPAAAPPFARRWYVGLEGVALAMRAPQLTSGSASFRASNSPLTLGPAALVGCQLSPRVGLEARLQSLPVASGFVYEHTSATDYTFLSNSYTSSYLYVPVQAVVQLVGRGHRLGLSAVAGGGLAWQGVRGSLATGAASASTATVTNPNGSLSTASYTQRLLQEKGSFGVLDAGLRGTCQLTPSLALHLTVQRLWAPGGPVRDLELTVTAPGEQATATLRSPVSGLAAGVSLCYGF